MKQFLYLAYKNEHIIEEAICSILSLLHVSKNKEGLKIIVYTDQVQRMEEYLAPYAQYIHYEAVDETMIQSWIGQGYFYTLKIKVVQHCLEQFGAKVLFIDSDTFFTKDPSPLFELLQEDQFVMYVDEYPIHSQMNGELYDLAKKDDRFPLDFTVWNSGVIGISAAHLSLLHECVNTIDLLYKLLPGQRTIEQIALSITLQKKGTISSAESYLVHYWCFKPFRKVLMNHFQLRSQANATQAAYFHRTDISKDVGFSSLPIEEVITHIDHAQVADFNKLLPALVMQFQQFSDPNFVKYVKNHFPLESFIYQ